MDRINVPADAPASHCIDCSAKRPGMIALIVTPDEVPPQVSAAWICEECILKYESREIAMTHLQDVFENRLQSPQ